MDSRVVDTDVLVIGGGLAGCWAAIAAKQFAPKVTLVDKAVVARSGCSAWAYYFLAPVSAEGLAEWRQELVEHGDYLNDQDWVDIILKENGQRLADMEGWGVPLLRDQGGNLIVRKGRGHNKTGYVTTDAKPMMEVLKKKASDLGVHIVERVMVTDLLTSDGKHPTRGAVTGAVGFDTMNEEFWTFRSKATVIASGPIDNKTNLSGDGVTMAFRAGAELLSMEFCQDAVCLLSDGEHNLGPFEILMAALGGRILNVRGERFMEKYAPVLKEKASWPLITQALAKEHMEGRGPARWDLSKVDSKAIDEFERLLPGRAAIFKRAGLDIRKDRVPFIGYVSVRSVAGNGGVRIDPDGKTSLPGLYAAGSVCKNQAHGTYAAGGLNLPFCCVSGQRSGSKAGNECGRVELHEPDAKQVESLRTQIYSPLKAKTGLTPDQMARRIDELTMPAQASILKTEVGIKETIGALGELSKNELPRIVARNAHELTKANQARNYALFAQLAFLAALERKESRSYHYRADYPYTDNKDWLKWSVVKLKEGGKIGITFEPVPIDRYPVKPLKREKVPYAVQL